MHDFVRYMLFSYAFVFVFILFLQYTVELIYYIVKKITKYRKEHF